MPFVPCSRYSSVEDRVRAVPEFFVATAFRGSHRFDSRRAETLELALAAAENLYEDRGIMIYAVAGGFQAMIGSWRP